MTKWRENKKKGERETKAQGRKKDPQCSVLYPWRLIGN
jgi:hypothetical protein